MFEPKKANYCRYIFHVLLLAVLIVFFSRLFICSEVHEVLAVFIADSNLVPRVLKLFGQRASAWRDSGTMDLNSFLFDWSLA